jgi:hypothetical protein
MKNFEKYKKEIWERKNKWKNERFEKMFEYFRFILAKIKTNY